MMDFNLPQPFPNPRPPLQNPFQPSPVPFFGGQTSWAGSYSPALPQWAHPMNLPPPVPLTTPAIPTIVSGGGGIGEAAKWLGKAALRPYTPAQLIGRAAWYAGAKGYEAVNGYIDSLPPTDYRAPTNAELPPGQQWAPPM